MTDGWSEMSPRLILTALPGLTARIRKKSKQADWQNRRKAGNQPDDSQRFYCGDIRHFACLNAENTHGVGRDFRQRVKFRAGGARQIQRRLDGLFNLFGTETHASQRNHAVRDLFCRERGFAPKFSSDFSQRVKFRAGLIFVTALTKRILVVEIRKTL